MHTLDTLATFEATKLLPNRGFDTGAILPVPRCHPPDKGVPTRIDTRMEFQGTSKELKKTLLWPHIPMTVWSAYARRMLGVFTNHPRQATRDRNTTVRMVAFCGLKGYSLLGIVVRDWLF